VQGRGRGRGVKRLEPATFDQGETRQCDYFELAQDRCRNCKDFRGSGSIDGPVRLLKEDALEDWESF
jgi:hypothetical protein